MDRDIDTLAAQRRLRFLIETVLAELKDQPPETDRALWVIVKVVAPLDVRLRALEGEVAALKQLFR